MRFPQTPILLAAIAALLTPLAVSAQAVRTNAGFRTGNIPRTDDDPNPTPQQVGFPVNFYGRTYAALFVNNNGNVTFDQPSDAYSPEGLGPGQIRPIIAPFFADVDTTGTRSKIVTFGRDTVDGRRAFGVNFVDVGYYSGNDDKLNSFQVVLIDRSDTGAGNFDIEFNYDRILWETGDVDGGTGGRGGDSASVGYSNGSGVTGTYFQFPGSLVAGSFVDGGPRSLVAGSQNSILRGRYVFFARSGTVSPVTITSLSPSSINAGGAQFTITVDGTGFVQGAVVRWNSTSLATSFVSSTRLTATVPASLVSAVAAVQISVANQTGPASNSLPFTIGTSPPMLTSLSPSSILAGSPLFVLTADGQNFTSTSTVRWNNAALVTTFANSTRLTATVPANLVAARGTAQVTVASANGTASGSLPFAITDIVVPPVTITGLSSPSTPTSNATAGLSLASAAPTALAGTLTLSFRPNASNTLATYRDPALVWVSSGLTTLDFTIAANSTTAILAGAGAFQQGTTAGDIIVTLTRLTANGVSVLPASVSRTLSVARSAPVLQDNSVKLLNITSTGFDVEFIAFSTPRDLASATFTFTPRVGANIEGASIPVDLRDRFNQWFSSSDGGSNGGLFRARVPFTFTGDASILSSVSIALVNSVGTSSPASGGR